MSAEIANITLIILIANIIAYPVLWRSKAIIHPGFHFSLIWMLSVLSQSFLTEIGIALLPYPEYVDELHIFVAFTATCFFIFSFFGRKHKEQPNNIDFIPRKRFFIILSIVVLISTIIWFLYSGYSFNMAANRSEITDNKAHVYRSFGIIDSFLSIIRSFLPLLAITAGYVLSKKIIEGNKYFSSLYLFLPLLTIIVFAIGTGGRAPILDMIKLYLIGVGLSLPFYLKFESLKKLSLVILIVALSIGIFSTFVSEQRIERSMGESGVSDVVEYDSKWVKKFAGVVEYMTAHYWGYQIRRQEMNNKLYFGTTTFYGFFDIRIPFSSQLGLKKSSLADLLNIEDYRLKIYKSNLEASFSTFSIFTPLVRDFGSKGAFIFLFFFILYSHYLFVNLISKRIKTPMAIIFFFLNYFYWSNSTFYSFYSYNIVNSILIPFYLFYILNRLKFT